MTILTVRKVMILISLAIAASALIKWGVWSIPPSTDVIVASLLLCCYVSIRDFAVITYIESRILPMDS